MGFLLPKIHQFVDANYVLLFIVMQLLVKPSSAINQGDTEMFGIFNSEFKKMKSFAINAFDEQGIKLLDSPVAPKSFDRESAVRAVSRWLIPQIMEMMKIHHSTSPTVVRKLQIAVDKMNQQGFRLGEYYFY